MTDLAQLLYWLLIGLVVGQGILVAGYLWGMRRGSARKREDQPCPKAAVILCVRGADPFLDRCLAGLLRQNYPDHTVCIVVDSERDPAWAIVARAIEEAEATNVRLSALTKRSGRCSLKISGILQAVEELDDSYRIVALIDSDTVPYPDWLRDLASPLADPKVGVSTGIRAYMPNRPTWGSLVRYQWNMAALIQMYWYGIAWGGSLALQADLLRETDLLDRLGTAFGEDSTICRTARRQGLRVAFVPSATMINRECCDLRGFYRFLQRQLLTVRLHNPWWWAVVAHGVVTSIAVLLAYVALVGTLIMGQWEPAGWITAGLVLYLSAMAFMMIVLERVVRRCVRDRGQRIDWRTPRTWVRLACSMPLTQVVYAAGLAVTLFVRSHRWRGVLYRFGGRGQVKIVDDRPYEPSQPAESGLSVQ